jgi:DNA polymerase III alpha subunit
MRAQLKVRTEYSFRAAYGPLKKVVGRLQQLGCKYAAITDRGSTFGHVQWMKHCKEAGIKPLLGVELGLVEDSSEKTKQAINWISLIARNNEGLREINRAVRKATEDFYYVPRVDYSWLHSVTDNVVVLLGSNPDIGMVPRNREYMFIEAHPATQKKVLDFGRSGKLPLMPCSDNFFPALEDRRIYEVCVGRDRQNRIAPMHLIDQWDLMGELDWLDESAFAVGDNLAYVCDAAPGLAEMVKFPAERSLREMCEAAAAGRGIDLNDPVYAQRLDRELGLIAQKKFEDYFYVIADMVAYAKQHMLVGPARGSSCGSLVCFLLGITDIDPIPYGLLFERFIDLTRKDLPDIDIDFQDERRDMVFDYLRQRYGADCVARIGTVSRYKAKSAVGDVAKELGIPSWEVQDFKSQIIERSSGDSRAGFCIMDSFELLEAGKRLMAAHPQMALAAQLEQHARGSGQHAAGVVVTAEPIENFVAVDGRSGTLQIDKYDGEKINLLKIDALGLRTLSVIQDCLDQIGWTREQLLDYRRDDQAAFDVLNAQQYAGIFQFEGFALQSLTRQIHMDRFEDIVAITALARPGPLSSGGASEWVKRRMGAPVSYLHPIVEDCSHDTYGIILYQEQVMRIAREVGKLTWEDVSTLRKAMSKSMGKEFFDQFWERFKVGAASQGIEEDLARRIWDQINTMGSWSFNKSHAVAYGLVSYWCLVLKAHFPLEFAAATLRHARDEIAPVKLLRELHRAGRTFKVFDRERSLKDWSVQDGALVGGLTNIKGIGEKMAQDIIMRRANGVALTPAQEKKLADPVTPFDSIFEGTRRFGALLADPKAHNISSTIKEIIDIDDSGGTVVFIGKLVEKNLRDLNEIKNLAKRGGRKVANNNIFLNITIEDDTGSIIGTVGRFDYAKWGRPLVDDHPIGTWFLWRGNVKAGFRKVYIERWRKLEDCPLGEPAAQPEQVPAIAAE